MSESRDRATFNVDIPCPSCGQVKILGYLLTNERDEHMHTHYVCTFWPSSKTPAVPGSSKPCGWHGWTVRRKPGPKPKPERFDVV